MKKQELKKLVFRLDEWELIFIACIAARGRYLKQHKNLYANDCLKMIKKIEKYLRKAGVCVI